MTTLTAFTYRFRWLQFPSMVLMFLLQRTPILRSVITTEFTIQATAGTVLKGVIATAAAMGTVHTVAGATELNAGSGGNPAQGTVGQPFTGGFSVVGAPAVAGSYRVTGALPAGLSITGIVDQTVNSSVVNITGTPTAAGSFDLSVNAWKGQNRTLEGGSPTFTYTIEISAEAGVAPTITPQPQSQTKTAGQSVTFSVTAAGDPAPTFQWRKNGTPIAGATAASLSLSALATVDAANYSVVITNASGSVTSAVATLTVTAAPAGPSLITHPVSQTVAAGGSVTFSAGVVTTGSASLQWLKNGTVVSGATSTSLTLNAVSAANSGRYTLRVTDSVGTIESRDAYLLVATPQPGAIVNESVNTSVGPGAALTVGFVLEGGSRQMLIRGVGPSLGLAPFGLAGVLPQPELQLNTTGAGGVVLETNAGWDNNPVIAATAQTVGAFALSSPADAVVLRTLNPGPHTAVISSGDGASGTAIVEAYAVGAGSGQLVNLSARKRLDGSNPSLTAGFSVSGNQPLRLLIRAVGPTLNQFLSGAELDDPTLTLNRLVGPAGEALGVVLTNDNWETEGNAGAIIGAAASVGAFPLIEGSKDAAVLVTLPAGNYTVQVERKGNAVGDALIEVYAAP